MLLMVKIVKYIVFCLNRSFHLLWPPVIPGSLVGWVARAVSWPAASRRLVNSRLGSTISYHQLVRYCSTSRFYACHRLVISWLGIAAVTRAVSWLTLTISWLFGTVKNEVAD